MVEEVPDFQEPDDELLEQLDRPLECSQCPKPISVEYTEIVGKCSHKVVMCSDCPNLKQRLHGVSKKTEDLTRDSLAGGLTCGNCHTKWESVRMGHPLGCGECYTVFAQLLLDDLVTSNRVPKRLAVKQKGIPAHVGRSPGEVVELDPKLRLLALNEALNETLSREDYEQAAWIRDQIKELTEETGGHEF